eukprot:COSAG01_NODE_18937_length_1042_cov_2.415695_1_plen_106_part_01
MPALCDAIGKRDWATVQKLLDGDTAGELAREKNDNGELPLHLALLYKAAAEVTQQVFEQHRDAAREKGWNGDLPLHLALRNKAAAEVTQQVFEQHRDAAREKNDDG